ncbi:cation efflux protein, CzcI-like [Acinetobacter ursingii]|uniref:cation efflux protein, CzcI-like n=1 Tax=Acinetobacter ursingii TaxID=108980 RepID=UPI002E18AEA8
MVLMKRSLLMAILLSLFMFQSLWNVAAAFCAHETASGSEYNAIPYHFGHHLDASVGEVSDHHKLKTDTANFKTTTHPAAIWMDHHDHLPSCLHIVVAETEQNALEPFRTGHLTRSVYDWANFYQSPHLIGLNPPPVVTPL